MPRIDLRQLILALTLVSVVLTLANALYSSYQVQEDLLIRTTLEANRVYAAKLADSTDNFLAATQQQLAYSHADIVEALERPAELDKQARRLQLSTNTFNAVLIVDARGHVLSNSPASLNLVGRQLHSVGNRNNLKIREPLISQPFITTTGKLVVSISHPLFAADGSYKGYVTGSIYLQENNILRSLLGQHYYLDGSYLYVVDSQRHLVYHRDTSRLGHLVTGNPVIEAVIAGEAGSMRLRNSQDVEMLAGYAPLQRVGWGLVAQRPLQATLEELEALTWHTLFNTLPLLLFSLLAIWGLSRLISLPLWQLAHQAREMDSPGAREAFEKVRSWYFEAAQLKLSLLAGLRQVNSKIHRLNHESLTDQLTGLTNRRGMDSMLGIWQAEGRSFALIMLDIDHFKQVNDLHGHDVGDKALQELATLMREGSRSQDLLCRAGGEEFAMFLPETSLDNALEIAERLRNAVARHVFATGGHLTVSLGIAHLPETSDNLADVLKSADLALYQAKHQGRNQAVRGLPR
ncbi:sensor domain-containing diguanylate cyclase [Phytopseudomonas dryadis]|uniref:diguanylate cyclase n=1 Tax=Phytopseudomonas dryadis TaxID=2487520 RepID=A0A4Q9QXV8_9GAMM|nr:MULTISPECIES: sensor domain-containing diguanylate cyclase [Pseudomonas]TBU87778.1 diguanylate cyclase [Pseudomonas dryadis]TBV00211.1 diguanylate cyclase [Pseudomonas dryadis]TBV14455.1 diguanylate cyclase [Pseudomonas sp. FRB 230]